MIVNIYTSLGQIVQQQAQSIKYVSENNYTLDSNEWDYLPSSNTIQNGTSGLQHNKVSSSEQIANEMARNSITALNNFPSGKGVVYVASDIRGLNSATITMNDFTY